tara:strand:- start:425 stop:922 length:498 start_codon:yes stop_codon:yes gene_type:complete
MTYETLNTETFIEIKYGNIYYELKEQPEDLTNKIPYDSLLEELQQFLSSMDQEKIKLGDINFPGGYESDDNLSDLVSMDQCLAMTLNYDNNYTLKDLQKIAEYYEISVRKLNKAELIEKILTYEDNSENEAITTRRKQLWNYMKQIKQDKYLKPFLIFDSPIISK